MELFYVLFQDTSAGDLYVLSVVFCFVLGYELRRLVSLFISYLYCFRIQTVEVRKPCLFVGCVWVRYRLMP